MTQENAQPPAVSVVIPTHGRVELFQETLDSLARQTFRDFEVIITDDSAEPEERAAIKRLAEGLAKSVPQTRYLFTQPCLHQATNTNQGLAAVRGEYVRILHSDDLLAPAALETEHRLMEQYRGRIGAIVHDLVRFTDKPQWSDGLSQTWQDPARYYRLRAWSAPLPTAVMLRRDVVEASGGMRDGFIYFCDSEFFMRWSACLQQRRLQVLNVSQGLVGWRMHQDHLSARLEPAEFTEALAMCREWRGQTEGAFCHVVPERFRGTFFRRADLLLHKRIFRTAGLMRLDAGLPRRFALMRKVAVEHGQPALFYGMMAKRARDAWRGRARAWSRLPTSPARYLNHDRTVPLGTPVAAA